MLREEHHHLVRPVSVTNCEFFSRLFVYLRTQGTEMASVVSAVSGGIISSLGTDRRAANATFWRMKYGTTALATNHKAMGTGGQGVQEINVMFLLVESERLPNFSQAGVLVFANRRVKAGGSKRVARVAYFSRTGHTEMAATSQATPLFPYTNRGCKSTSYFAAVCGTIYE